MKLPAILTAMSFLAFAGLIPASALEIGQAAPDVSSVDETGQTVRLGEVYQQGVTLVYFYPKSGTPGCTAQACSLRDSFEGLKTRGVRVIGVSGDKVDGQKKFQDKYKLPFTLLADSDGGVAKAFGVPSFLGFTKRQSFLIKNGKLVWRDLSVSPQTHVAEVNKALDALK
jgi:thioredoxin-dependent peroxiredoxin